MATKAKAVSLLTPITKNNIQILRNDVTKAIADVMAKHGLVSNVGRITYGAGEFRCKLTVNHPAAPIANSVPGATPVINEYWSFGGKTYRVVAILGTSVTLSRPSRAARGHYCSEWGSYVANFRAKLSAVIASGTKVR